MFIISLSAILIATTFIQIDINKKEKHEQFHKLHSKYIDTFFDKPNKFGRIIHTNNLNNEILDDSKNKIINSGEKFDPKPFFEFKKIEIFLMIIKI